MDLGSLLGMHRYRPPYYGGSAGGYYPGAGGGGYYPGAGGSGYYPGAGGYPGAGAGYPGGFGTNFIGGGGGAYPGAGAGYGGEIFDDFFKYHYVFCVCDDKNPSLRSQRKWWFKFLLWIQKQSI